MKTSEKVQHARQAERGGLRSLGLLLEEMGNPKRPTPVAGFAVADLPSAADYPNHVVYCSNGAAGSPILAFSDGTNWKRSDTGATVAAA